jgi:hypothetical protein
MPTLAQYQAQLNADTEALAKSQATLASIQITYHSGSVRVGGKMVQHPGVWTDINGAPLAGATVIQRIRAAGGSLIAFMYPSTTDLANLTALKTQWQNAVTAAQAAVTLDETMVASASYTENQLAASQIFTPTQSTQLQSLSNSTANAYLPSLRGYVVNPPPHGGLPQFTPDVQDTVTPSGSVGMVQRATPDFQPIAAGQEAYFMKQYFAGAPVFMYCFGGSWRGLVQTSGAACKGLVYTQTDVTSLIASARQDTGNVAFDAAPMASIVAYVTKLCLSDAQSALNKANQNQAAWQAAQNSGGGFGGLFTFLVIAAVIAGGVWALADLSTPAIVDGSAAVTGASSGAIGAAPAVSGGLSDSVALAGGSTMTSATSGALIDTSSMLGSSSLTQAGITNALGGTGAISSAGVGTLAGASTTTALGATLTDTAVTAAIGGTGTISTVSGFTIADALNAPTSALRPLTQAPVTPAAGAGVTLPSLATTSQALGVAGAVTSLGQRLGLIPTPAPATALQNGYPYAPAASGGFSATSLLLIAAIAGCAYILMETK